MWAFGFASQLPHGAVTDVLCMPVLLFPLLSHQSTITLPFLTFPLSLTTCYFLPYSSFPVKENWECWFLLFLKKWFYYITTSNNTEGDRSTIKVDSSENCGALSLSDGVKGHLFWKPCWWEHDPYSWALWIVQTRLVCYFGWMIYTFWVHKPRYREGTEKFSSPSSAWRHRGQELMG